MSGLLVVTPSGPEADTLCAAFRARGFDVHQAPSGASAIEAAVRHLPDAVLMDPNLSPMDRWHAVKRLNTEPSTHRIPVLTLGSDVGTEAGMDRIVARISRTLGSTGSPRRPPVTGLAALARAAEAPPARVAVGESPEGADRIDRMPPSARILVVDDNAMNRDMLTRRLERKGFDVVTADGGEAALAILATEPVDLVLLDWMMPGLSGIDVLKRIRERQGPIALPVIMATAKTEAQDVVEALAAEANDFVSKPLNFDIVLARIRAQLHLVQTHRDLVASERRFRALLENTGDLVVEFRPTGEVSYVSPASRALLGFEPAELVARPFHDWLHPLDRAALEARQQSLPGLPPAYTFIARMGARDGRWLWVETSCRALREGDHVLIHAVCRDVSEHLEGLGGDEPPLPLGGDILAHPGWRGTGPTFAVSEPPRDPVVVTVVVGGKVPIEQVTKRVSDELRRALEEERDGRI